MLWKKDKDNLYIDIFEEHRRENLNLADLSLSDQDEESSESGKNDEKAKYYLLRGDLDFDYKKWLTAIELYNESLCYAENGSQQIGLAYAKRSQCFQALKRFDLCIIDIELAERSNYPADELAQLKKRKEVIQKLIERGAQEELIQPKLSFEPNVNFPEMANIVEFRQNEEFGRHLVATADIDVGDVILYEKSLVVTPDECYRYCNVCMLTPTNLIPCKNCNITLLCIQCNDSNNFHLYECDMFRRFETHWRYVAMGIRTLLIALNLFPNADDLMKFVEESLTGVEELPTSIKDTQTKYRWFLRLYKTTFSDSSNIEIANRLKLLSPLIYQAIFEHEAFSAFLRTEQHRRFFMHLVFYHVAVSFILSSKVDFSVIIQFMNHSCTPCVNTFLIDGVVIGVAFRPIRKGEQIFKCYYDDGEARKTFPERQKYIKEHFHFECKCERCLCKDVPPPALVKAMRSDYSFKLLREFFDDSNTSDQNKRKDLTKVVRALLRKHYRVAWSNELSNSLNAYRNLLIYKFTMKTKF